MLQVLLNHENNLVTFAGWFLRMWGLNYLKEEKSEKLQQIWSKNLKGCCAFSFCLADTLWGGAQSVAIKANPAE